MAPAAKNTTSAAALTEVLREKVLSGDLKPGERIVESRLCAALGVSRTPLRGSLRRLEGEGWVRSVKNSGFSVAPLSAREVSETYPILAALETAALKSSWPLAVSVAPELRELNEKFRKARGAQTAIKRDAAWHRLLLSKSLNNRLSSLIESLTASLKRYEYLYLSDAKLSEISYAQRAQVTAALEEENLPAAAAALEANWQFGMAVLLERLEGEKRQNR